MDACDHIVEPVEQFVGIIECAVRQDVALGALEEPKFVAERLVQLVDLCPLRRERALDRQPAGIGRRPGMIGDP